MRLPRGFGSPILVEEFGNSGAVRVNECKLGATAFSEWSSVY